MVAYLLWNYLSTVFGFTRRLAWLEPLSLDSLISGDTSWNFSNSWLTISMREKVGIRVGISTRALRVFEICRSEISRVLFRLFYSIDLWTTCSIEGLVLLACWCFDIPVTICSSCLAYGFLPLILEGFFYLKVWLNFLSLEISGFRFSSLKLLKTKS